MKFVAVFVLCVVISQCVALPKDIKLKKLLQNIEDEVEELKDFAREMKDDGNRRLGVNKIISIDKKLGSNTDEKTPSPSYKRSIEEINRQNNIFGDIKYADGLGKRNAIDYYRWLPTSETQQLKIPYKIDGSLDSAASAMIEKSINTMNQVLDCHDEAWTPYNPSIHGHYVKFFKERGCWSYVGKVQFDVGFQEISIGKGCEYEDTILHEMMHAMGFHHEQNRPDRDNYIKVHLENVEADAKSQFDKQSGTLTFNTEYDYKSIMHYYAYAFSKNGEPTITSLSEAIQTDEIGKSLELTDLDIEELKKYFNCLASPTTDQPTEGPTALPTDESTDLATDGTDESTDLQTDGTDESTDLQTDGTDESTDLQTDGTDESTDLQTDGTDESTDLQTDGTDESTDLQTDGTDESTDLQTDGTDESTDLQTDGTDESTDLQTDGTDESTDLQTDGTDESTDLQTDGTDESTDLQTDGTDESTDLQTDGTDESTDLQTDGTDESTDLQTDGTDESTDLQTDGTDESTDLQTDGTDESTDLQTDGTDESTDLQTDGTDESTDLQTDGTDESTDLQTDGTDESTDLQTDGTDESTDLQTDGTDESTDLQTDGTDESTDLQTDGTDESTDLQTDGTDESTDLQTDGTDESTDLQTDGTDESTDLQTDGTDESTDLQTDGTDESTDLQTDGTDKPTGGKIAECKIDETNLDGTKCNRFKIKGFKPGRKCEDIRKDCKGKENKCFKNSMRKKCRLTCGYCKPQTMGPYMQAIRRGRISTTITNEELSKKFGKYCVENFVQFCVSFTYSLDEHQVDPKSISIKTNVRSVEPFKRKIKPKSAFHNIEVKEDYEAGQWEEGLGTLEVACGKSYRFRLTEQNAEKEKVKYQNMAIFLGPCPR